MAYAMARQGRFSFTSLGAPANVPLQLEIEYFGDDKLLVDAGFDADAAAPINPEAIVGQTARAYLGSPSTAFDDLDEAVGLLGLDLTVPSGATPRKYGSADDKFTHIGKIKSAPTAVPIFYETADRLADIWATYADTDAVAHNLRCRFEFNGKEIGSTGFFYQLRFDGLLAFTTVPVQNDANGARTFAPAVNFAYDADLGSDLAVSLQLPTPV